MPLKYIKKTITNLEGTCSSQQIACVHQQREYQQFQEEPQHEKNPIRWLNSLDFGPPYAPLHGLYIQVHPLLLVSPLCTITIFPTSHSQQCSPFLNYHLLYFLHPVVCYYCFWIFFCYATKVFFFLHERRTLLKSKTQIQTQHQESNKECA